MKRVLLYGNGLQVLSIARSLSENNHVVFVAGDDLSISQYSRYVTSCFNISCDTIGFLLDVLKEKKIDVVIPMEDKWARTLSHHKDEIETKTSAKCAICCPDIYDLVESKTRLLEFCKANNIPHPKTEKLSSNLDDLSEQFVFPSLIKPSYSEGARGIKMIYSLEELKEVAHRHIQRYGECSLQEYIENDHYFNVMLYRQVDGSFANHVVTKITRYYPIKGGSSCFCTTIKNESLVNICKDLLTKLNWVGFADFDVLEKGDGDYRIIEINPRVPASVQAAAISGVNFGEIIVSDLMGEKIPQYTYLVGKQLRYLGLDIAWFLSSPNRFKVIPSWFKFFGKNIFYQEGGIKDWKAMLASLFMGTRKILSPSFRKQKEGMN